MLIRLAELLQYDPQKVAELSCMSGICHVMEQMTLDRVFRCKSRHWTDFASICGLNRLVESGGGFSLLILLIGSTRSATGLRQRLQRLISAESLADPRGKTFQAVGATSCESMGWVGWGCTGKFYLSYITIILYPIVIIIGSFCDMFCGNLLLYFRVPHHLLWMVLGISLQLLNDLLWISGPCFVVFVFVSHFGISLQRWQFLVFFNLLKCF